MCLILPSIMYLYIATIYTGGCLAQHQGAQFLGYFTGRDEECTVLCCIVYGGERVLAVSIAFLCVCVE